MLYPIKTMITGQREEKLTKGRGLMGGVNTFYHPFSWKTYLYIFASFLFLLKISISMSTFERPEYLECVIIKTCQHLVCESSIAENGLVGLLYLVKFTKKNVLIQGDVEVRQKMLKTVLTCTIINIASLFQRVCGYHDSCYVSLPVTTRTSVWTHRGQSGF